MSIVNKASLKNDFLNNEVITQSKMEDLIDSCYNNSGSGLDIIQFDRTLTADEINQH